MAESQSGGTETAPEPEKPEKKKVLTARQKIFVQALADDPTMTQTAAAEKAGFKNPRVVGSQLLNKPEFAHVKTELEFLKGERMQRLGITPGRTLERLAEIAYTDWGEIYDSDNNLKDLTKLSRAQRSVVREIKTSWTVVKVQHPAQNGNPAWVETVLKQNVNVKLAAPETALKMLGKNQGLWIERIQVNITEKAEQAKRDVNALFDRAMVMAASELADKAKSDEEKIAGEIARAIALSRIEDPAAPETEPPPG